MPTSSSVRQALQGAQLRASIALSENRAQDAAKDLLAVFVLGRLRASDSTLGGAALQLFIESAIAEFVAA